MSNDRHSKFLLQISFQMMWYVIHHSILDYNSLQNPSELIMLFSHPIDICHII